MRRGGSLREGEAPRSRTGSRGYNCTGRTTSHTERRQSRRLLTIKAPGKSLSFLIVRKLHGKNDCLVVLIVIELRWLVSVAIEPFAMAAKATENPAAGSRTVTVRLD